MSSLCLIFKLCAFLLATRHIRLLSYPFVKLQLPFQLQHLTYVFLMSYKITYILGYRRERWTHRLAVQRTMLRQCHCMGLFENHLLYYKHLLAFHVLKIVLLFSSCMCFFACVELHYLCALWLQSLPYELHKYVYTYVKLMQKRQQQLTGVNKTSLPLLDNSIQYDDDW